MNKLNFLTAGFPSITKGNIFNAIKDLKTLKLDGMELEFVHNIWIKNEKEEIQKILSEKNDLIFTAHSPYYVNLASLDLKIQKASIDRIYNTAKITSLLNGYSITFHPGYYLKQDNEKAYNIVKTNLKEVIKKMKDENINIWIRPETTGKETQIGNLDECVKLSEDLEMVLPCIDFAHLHARNGKNNTKNEFENILNKIENKLGKIALENMHIHISGINYTNKGERNHLTLEESDLNWKTLLNTFKDYNLKGVIISESPNIEKDAMLMQNYYKG